MTQTYQMIDNRRRKETYNERRKETKKKVYLSYRNSQRLFIFYTFFDRIYFTIKSISFPTPFKLRMDPKMTH
jgi:hypothetical protein